MADLILNFPVLSFPAQIALCHLVWHNPIKSFLNNSPVVHKISMEIMSQLSILIKILYNLINDRGLSVNYRYDRTISLYSGMIFFRLYLTDFSYFPLKIVFRKFLDMLRTGKKMTGLKGGVDGFSTIFLRFSVILFSNQNHPCTLKK